MASWSLNDDLAEVEVVHEENRAEHRDGQRQDPHQAGVLQVDPRNRRRLIEVDQADPHQDGRQQLHAADADIAAGRVEAERPALHAVGIEERDVGHAGGKIAAAETGRGGHQQHQPERRIGLADEIGEPERRDEQHRGAEDGPVAAAERGHGKGVGKPHQRADQPGYRHQLKQLVGRVSGSRPAAIWSRRCSRSARPKTRHARQRSTRSDCAGRQPCRSSSKTSHLRASIPKSRSGSALSPEISFLRLYRPSGVIETACERHGGAPPGEPDLAKPQIRMIGFDGRLQWRQH